MAILLEQVDPFRLAVADEDQRVSLALLELFRRYVLRDLRGSAYVAVSMRIILAVIGAWRSSRR